jgi:predicted Fe-S protein YdhL (DUF1289 family)
MRHSPCIGICKLDDATGYCLGCGRTGTEIGDWISMSEDQRDAVWHKLPARLSTLAVRVRLLPWTRDELVEWVRDSLESKRGSWVAGAPGAVAEFPCNSARTVSVDVGLDSVIAHAPDSSFRLRINEKVRAFAFKEGGPIVLGLPKGRAVVRSYSVLQPLGSDADAIDESQRSEQLFDLGFGRQNSRFCVRTGDEALASTLSVRAGRRWPEVMSAIGEQLVSASPNRVVESAAARIEVRTKIPLPGHQSPAGAHTHFLPDVLKTDREIAASLELPDYAAPVAIFYPTGTSN